MEANFVVGDVKTIRLCCPALQKERENDIVKAENHSLFCFLFMISISLLRYLSAPISFNYFCYSYLLNILLDTTLKRQNNS